MDFSFLNNAVMSVFGETVPIEWLDSPDRTRDGIYDSRHYSVDLPEGEVGVSELLTTLAVIADPDDPVEVGERLVARETTYRVKDTRPDGQGMTVLELEITDAS